MLLASDFDFELPSNRIAQLPLVVRDQSRLLLCTSKGRLGDWHAPFHFEDRRFRDIAGLLTSNDFLIMNDAKVLPVRLLGHRDDDGKKGGDVEAVLTRKHSDLEWTAIMRLSARIRPGLKVIFEPGVVAEVLSTHEERVATNGDVRLRFSGLSLQKRSFEDWLTQNGHVPLPPYIEREDNAQDKKVYQTVYASKTGSAAAPTAGFHFSADLLSQLGTRGVEHAFITLHVGVGTFRPIKTETVDEHPMHEERFEITPEFAEKLARAKASGKRIVAVGTTVVRAVESWLATGEGKTGEFSTRAFIKPGYRFLGIDDLITNFHLPRSTLLVLVAGAMGQEAAKAAYAHALKGEYRFFSYGDAMFIRGEK